jgi:dihydroorotase-like cyclic amidohydrolase
MSSPVIDLAILNGVVVNHDGRTQVDIGVAGGRIVALADRGELLPAVQTVDAAGRFITPGAIDPHVHLGLYSDLATDFETETRSAVLGGVTFIKHMLIEPGSYAPAIPEAVELGVGRSYVDFAFDIEMRTEQHLREIPLYDSLGISSYKFFMTYRGAQAAVRGIEPIDDGYIYEGLRMIASLGRPATARVHCENIEIIERLMAGVRARGEEGLRALYDARPRFVEAVDVVQLTWLARFLGCPLCVVHVSAAESVDVIRDALAAGADLLGETCLHFLHFTYDSPLGNLVAITPALKDAESVARLWDGVREGTINSIGSDHVWLPKEDKHIESVWTSVGGVGGLGLLLPFVLSEGVSKGRITLERAVAITAYETARWYGFYPRKGAIELGSDADINVLDLDEKRVVTPELLDAAAKWTPYEGLELTGWPAVTIVGGKVVAEGGRLVDKPGSGRFVRARVD